MSMYVTSGISSGLTDEIERLKKQKEKEKKKKSLQRKKEQKLKEEKGSILISTL